MHGRVEYNLNSFRNVTKLKSIFLSLSVIGIILLILLYLLLFENIYTFNNFLKNIVEYNYLLKFV